MRQPRQPLLLICILILLFVTACANSAAAPTPDPRLAVIKILSTQTHLIGSDIAVVGTLQNNDKTGHDIKLRASFLDPNGNSIGSGTGVAEDVSAGATANFEIHGTVDPARFGSTQVTVVSLSEQK